VSVIAVILSTSYHYLITRSILEPRWKDIRRLVVRDALLQALFICLISQMWIMPYGWEWYFFPGTGGYAAALYAVFVLLVAFLFLIDRVFRSSFDHTAAVRGSILIKEVANGSWSSLLGSALITLVLIIVWQLLSASGLYLVISSPVAVLKASYRMLAEGTVITKEYSTLWKHIGVSLSEVLGGLVLGGGSGLVVYKIVSSNDTIKNWLFPILPLTYVAPIVLPIVLIIWLKLLGSWQTVAGVALLIFFPFVQALWGLHDRPLLCRILLATDDALPFAFVAMLFGEAMSAVAGLGFLMVFAHVNSHTVPEGIAVALVTIVLLVVFSSTLRLLAKRLYFSAAT